MKNHAGQVSLPAVDENSSQNHGWVAVRPTALYSRWALTRLAWRAFRRLLCAGARAYWPNQTGAVLNWLCGAPWAAQVRLRGLRMLLLPQSALRLRPLQAALAPLPAAPPAPAADGGPCWAA